MARFIRLTGVQTTAPTTVPAEETIWREGLRVCSTGAVSQVQLEMADRSNVAERMPEYCSWLTKQHGILTKHGNATVRSIDFSKNGIADAGALVLMKTIAEICPALRVLKLYENKLMDPAPFADLLLRAHLLELHLSNNHFGEKAVSDLVVAACQARNERGDFAYPVTGGKKATPLWLRVENQRGKLGGTLANSAVAELARIGRPVWKAVCLLDGGTRTRWCVPAQCACLATQPAVHLTYLDLPKAKRVKAKAKKHAVATSGTNRWNTTPGKTASVAPWRKARGAVREQAPVLISEVDFPPLPGARSQKLQTPVASTCKEEQTYPLEAPPGLHTAPNELTYEPPPSMPCKIVLGDSDQALTAGVSIADIMYYELPMSCCEDWRSSQ